MWIFRHVVDYFPVSSAVFIELFPDQSFSVTACFTALQVFLDLPDASCKIRSHCTVSKAESDFQPRAAFLRSTVPAQEAWEI